MWKVVSDRVSTHVPFASCLCGMVERALFSTSSQDMSPRSKRWLGHLISVVRVHGGGGMRVNANLCVPRVVLSVSQGSSRLAAELRIAPSGFGMSTVGHADGPQGAEACNVCNARVELSRTPRGGFEPTATHVTRLRRVVPATSTAFRMFFG